MSKSTAIKVEHLSKAYQLGQIGTGTISRDIGRWYAKVRGKEDPFLRIGEDNNQNIKSQSSVVWSLKDINFEIDQGDAVGIIGRNGAGKSTLLKILSKVTSPTTGRISGKGRIASLLEVGTGFHPELSGRENIYLNGAILGMRKKEIQRKLDEIVDFAGIERYLDTPVKKYSSGMYVRLAFAVAAHLESEILIVDEVLAVGDAEFQKKCLGKMEDVSKGEGRTVLFVSHNMLSIQRFCKKAILLQNGKLINQGDVTPVISNYLLSLNTNSKSKFEFTFDSSLNAYAYKMKLMDIHGAALNEISIGKPWKVEVYFKVNREQDNLIIGLGMLDSNEIPIRTSWTKADKYQSGDYIATFEENDIIFCTGRFKLLIGLSIGKTSIQYIDQNLWFNFSDMTELNLPNIQQTTNGVILNQMKMNIRNA